MDGTHQTIRTQALLSRLFAKLECKQVYFFKLASVLELFSEDGQLGFDLVKRVTSKLGKPADKLLARENTHLDGVEMPCNDDGDHVRGVGANVFKEPSNTLDQNRVLFLVYKCCSANTQTLARGAAQAGTFVLFKQRDDFGLVDLWLGRRSVLVQKLFHRYLQVPVVVLFCARALLGPGDHHPKKKKKKKTHL